jgi:endonuclease YncB( thermonuclease family)
MARDLGHCMRASVIRVIDGDTVEVILQMPVTIRIKDLWTPETRGIDRIAGHAAKEALETLLPVHAPIEVFIPTGEAQSFGDVMSFGRPVGEVYRVGDEDPVSEIMIQMGHGTRYKHGN